MVVTNRVNQLKYIVSDSSSCVVACFIVAKGVSIHIHPISGSVAGHNAKLTCQGGSSTSSVIWHFNNETLVVCRGGIPIPSSSDFRCIHTNNLDIMYLLNVTKAKEGFYSCEKPGVGLSDERFLEVYSLLVYRTTSPVPTTPSSNPVTTGRHTATAGTSKAPLSVQSNSSIVTSTDRSDSALSNPTNHDQPESNEPYPLPSATPSGEPILTGSSRHTTTTANSIPQPSVQSDSTNFASASTDGSVPGSPTDHSPIKTGTGNGQPATTPNAKASPSIQANSLKSTSAIGWTPLPVTELSQEEGCGLVLLLLYSFVLNY